MRYKNIGLEPLKDKRSKVFVSGLIGTYLHTMDPEQSLPDRLANGFFVRIPNDIENIIEHENPQFLGWMVRIVLEEIELAVTDIAHLRERARSLLRTNEEAIQGLELKSPLKLSDTRPEYVWIRCDEHTASMVEPISDVARV